MAQANAKRHLVPWNTQNHKSSNEELDSHPVMCSPISSPDGILASERNSAKGI